MELNKLYYFHITAKHQNITKAAEELYVSQPALTKSIKTLEESIGLQLFYKKGKHIYLTAFGEYLKSQTDRIFAIWSSVLHETKRLKKENASSIRLNVLAATSMVTDAVLEYKRINTDAIFHLSQNEETNCDISITIDSVKPIHLPEFTKRYIFKENVYLAAPKIQEYNEKKSINLAEVSEKGFVTLSGSKLFRAVCDTFCESVGFVPNIIFESDSPATVKNIIKAGAGVGFWPEFSWSEFPTEDINLIPIANPICQRELIIGLHMNQFTPPVVTEFYSFLLEYIKQQTKSQSQQERLV
ncbi:MAG: LysR family transcriptional regulator [Ruminococcaceae bacterium]|nr:LysR family transcriptional regulator [Oscillospiraceae bacterium]